MNNNMPYYSEVYKGKSWFLYNEHNGFYHATVSDKNGYTEYETRPYELAENARIDAMAWVDLNV